MHGAACRNENAVNKLGAIWSHLSRCLELNQVYRLHAIIFSNMFVYFSEIKLNWSGSEGFFLVDWRKQ